MNQVFVFGSNLAGVHGAGAAREAMLRHGAEYHTGSGRTGNAYALPTKDENIVTLPLSSIDTYVQAFCNYAAEHRDEKFFVTRIGCGLAGYKDADIAPMFKTAPANCILPIEWKPFLNDDVISKVSFHKWGDGEGNWTR